MANTDAKAVNQMLSLAKQAPGYRWFMARYAPAKGSSVREVELVILKPTGSSFPAEVGKRSGVEWALGGRIHFDREDSQWLLACTWSRGTVSEGQLSRILLKFKTGDPQNSIPKITKLDQYALVEATALEALAPPVQPSDEESAPKDPQDVAPPQVTALFDADAWKALLRSVEIAYGAADKGISRLQTLMRSQGIPRLTEIADTEMDVLTGPNRAELMSALYAIDPQGQSLSGDLKALSGEIDKTLRFLRSDERVDAVEDNPGGMPVGLRDPLDASLDAMNTYVSALGL
ncbi:MAG: hypothetical protein H6739_12870 [Alphaproteobacteria bacterium]|nr:hypothetical protein [Alphaproteobacteria bacterium]